MDLSIGPVFSPLTNKIRRALLINEKQNIEVIKKSFLSAKVLYLLKATKAHNIRLVSKLISATINANESININFVFSKEK